MCDKIYIILQYVSSRYLFLSSLYFYKIGNKIDTITNEVYNFEEKLLEIDYYLRSIS